MDLSFKNIWKITYPIFIGMLLQQIVGITDVIFLGHIGEIALSGSALGSTYFLTVFMVASGFSMGAQIIMARRNGEQNYRKIGPVFYQAATCLFISSWALIIFSYFFTPWFLDKIISSQEVYDATVDYISWRFLGFVPLFIIIIIRSFYIAITQTKVLTYVSVFTVTGNIFFNYCLIFGNFGFPQMGIAGAALASVLAETLSLIFLLIYGFYQVDLKKYALHYFIFRNFKILKEIWSLSVWTMLQQFISIASWFVFFLAIEHLGSTALAVSNILRSISSFPFLIAYSLAVTAGTLTSNLIGAGEENRVIYCCNKLMVLSAAITLPLLLILAFFDNQVLYFYTSEQNIIDFAKNAYLVMLGSNILIVPSIILFNAILGTGQTKVAMRQEFVASIFYLLHIALVIFYLKADIAWCWTVDYTYNIFILLFSAYYMYRKKWCCKII